MPTTQTNTYESVRELIECSYHEIKRLSSRKMLGERRCHSWTESVLVNELVERLLRSSSEIPLDEPGFYCLASKVMSNLLAEHGRRRTTRKRKHTKEQLGLSDIHDDLSPAKLTPEQWVELSDCLDAYAKKYPRAVEVFRMRLYGFKNDEAAENHKISRGQASADYRRVLAYLIKQFRDGDSDRE